MICVDRLGFLVFFQFWELKLLLVDENEVITDFINLNYRWPFWLKDFDLQSFINYLIFLLRVIINNFNHIWVVWIFHIVIYGEFFFLFWWIVLISLFSIEIQPSLDFLGFQDTGMFLSKLHGLVLEGLDVLVVQSLPFALLWSFWRLIMSFIIERNIPVKKYHSLSDLPNPDGKLSSTDQKPLSLSVFYLWSYDPIFPEVLVYEPLSVLMELWKKGFQIAIILLVQRLLPSNPFFGVLFRPSNFDQKSSFVMLPLLCWTKRRDSGVLSGSFLHNLSS